MSKQGEERVEYSNRTLTVPLHSALYLNKGVSQSLYPNPHGAMPLIAPSSLLHRVPVDVDDLVQVANENLGYLIRTAFEDAGEGGVVLRFLLRLHSS